MIFKLLPPFEVWWCT